MMKTSGKLSWYLLVAGAVLSLSCAAWSAELITASPGQLSVTGMKGAVEKRSLLFKTKIPAKDMKIISLDLNRENGDGVFSAEAVRVELADEKNNADGFVTTFVTIDLGKADSGEYKGELLISYKDGALSVPVTVKVKDMPWWPLFFICGGIILGTGVSFYKARGKPRDEILVRIEHVRAQMKSDPNMADAFKTAIESELLDVGAALQSEKWEDAKKALDDSERLTIHWRKGRSDWLEQFDYSHELEVRIGEMFENAACTMALKRGLKDAVRQAHEEGPDVFREKLNGFREQANRYFEISAALDELNRLRNSVILDNNEELRGKAMGYQWNLYTLPLDNEKECSALHQTIKNDIVTLRELPANGEKLLLAGGERKIHRRGNDVAPASPVLIAPVPEARMLRHPKDIVLDAGARLRIFKLATYVIVVVFLAGTGFGELYWNNPIFGANAWGDYFALLGWGFGSEATRAAVTDMVKGWGLKE